MALVKSSTFGWACQKIGFLLVLGILFSLGTLFSRISPRRSDFDLENSHQAKPSPEEEELASYDDQYFPPQCPTEQGHLDRNELARKSFYFDCEVLTRPELLTWRVLNCKSTQRCGLGHLVVQPYDYARCERLKVVTLSTNRTYDQFLKEELGPDAFLAQIHGSQVYAIDQWIFTDDCAYKLPYQLSSSTDLFLDLIHVGSQYDAIGEMKSSKASTPQVLLKSHPLHLCEECVTPSYSHEHPACQSIQELHGILVNTKEGKMTWRPAGCTLPSIQESCLNIKRRIIFLGDETIYDLMNGLFKKASLETTQLLEVPTTTTRRVRNLSGTFLKFSGQLTGEMIYEISHSDMVILNHPRKPGNAMMDYVEQGIHIIEQLTSILDQPLELLLVQNFLANQETLHTAILPTTHFYREQLGNRLLSERLRRFPKVQIINPFQESLSLFNENPGPQERYPLLTSIIIKQLMVKMNLCPSYHFSTYSSAHSNDYLE